MGGLGSLGFLGGLGSLGNLGCLGNLGSLGGLEHLGGVLGAPVGKKNGAGNVMPAPFFSCFILLDVDYRLGLTLLHSEMAGTMFSVTSSSRILQRCS